MVRIQTFLLKLIKKHGFFGGHAATGVFLFLLFAATVVLSVSAMRKLSKRVVTESTDLFDHEV